MLQADQEDQALASKNHEMSELVRETWRHYQLKQQAPVNSDLIAALRAVQDSAKRAGLDKLTEREIESEVIAHRRERDKKIKQPVS